MELPQELDDYIKQLIDHTVGLPVPNQTLLLTLHSLEADNRRLRDQCLAVHAKLKEKDEFIARARAESSFKAKAIKRFVGENHRLRKVRASLVIRCSRLEQDCLMYYGLREALVLSRNQADERVILADIRLRELEVELSRVVDEGRFYKIQFEKVWVDSLSKRCSLEQNLLDGLVASVVSGDEAARTAHVIWEASSSHGVEVCNMFMRMWNEPGTQNIIHLVAQVRRLQEDRDHLRINLLRAGEEVRLLFEENKRLARQLSSQRKQIGSDEEHT